MRLKDDAARALDAWLGAPTWHTPDDSDMDRWYDFVNQYQKDHGYTIDEVGLREMIERKLGGSVGDDLRDIIRDRISLAYNLLSARYEQKTVSKSDSRLPNHRRLQCSKRLDPLSSWRQLR